MKVSQGSCWGFVPARGGSKSVPLKNLAPLGGRPLLDFSVSAAQRAQSLSRIICSTDSEPIAAHCKEIGIEVHPRPAELGGDATPLFDVLVHFFDDVAAREGEVPELIALIQPTSPFLRPEDVDNCVGGLLSNPEAASAQTVIPCPHNHHAYNQRVVSDGRVAFRFVEERRQAYNKQTKPLHFLFGNLVVFRTIPALEQRFVFAEPSLAYEIPAFYGLDCDGPDDFRLAQAMLHERLVELPHLSDGNLSG